MILKNDSFIALADKIKKEDLKIVIFGAGMIGTVTTINILDNYDILNKVDCFVDNDKAKWGSEVCDKKYTVNSPDYLKNINPKNTILLLTISRFSEVLRQLDAIDNLKNMTCYIVPIICISNFLPSDKDETIKESDEMLIPKKIHYMWLGNNFLPKTLQKCIDSWKKFCPDYEIICWNESNYDISKNLYMKEAYENRMFGFVPDYARLDILYNHGGIYLDTDVELLKSLDEMLYQKGFCCAEKWQAINFGGGSGCVKGNKAVGKLLEARKNLRAVNDDGSLNKNTCGFYDTITMIKSGYRLNGMLQTIDDMNIYPYEYFHPYDYMSAKCTVTDHTYSIHHFNGGWLDPTMKESNIQTAQIYDNVLKRANALTEVSE